ncbi:unnamed protein product [Cylicocyclus nassatus]|uniref:Uncharacterized protein n=1 Tax=Cylicocyclus nassatus TaxID=53992 RepID=A0AA36H8F1_CYLNA|nr:unnamed protein product [Cylicocyclus nassatus]
MGGVGVTAAYKSTLEVDLLNSYNKLLPPCALLFLNFVQPQSFIMICIIHPSRDTLEFMCRQSLRFAKLRLSRPSQPKHLSRHNIDSSQTT